MTPNDRHYTSQHEWIRLDGNKGTVGITDHAQGELGDITFIELPEIGQKMEKKEEACVIESCKAAVSIYAPADGKVVEVNKDLDGQPELVNSDPYGEGWIFKIEVSDPGAVSSLMDAGQYEGFLGEKG